MSVAADAEPYLRGEEALASGDFDAAREAFAASLERGETPEARDGLGRALWWTGDVEDALAERERAYALYRRSGDVATAARIAVWVAREYAEALGNAPASSGWLARASGLLRDEPPSAAHGWLDVTIGTLSHDPSEMRARAASAIDRARAIGDADLEASALALLGRALILSGHVDRGMTALDEAMTATTAGEVGDALVFGDVCCLVTRACEEAGEVARLMRWNEVIQRYLERHHHAPLLSFCGTCCAEMMQANGALSEAERWLVTSVEALEATGHRARCVHPVAKLAELRVLQGRLEEAERVLAGYEDEPDAIAAIAAVHRAKGEATIAKALLLRRLNLLGDSILAVPLLDALVEVDVSTRDVDAARDAARRLRAIAEASGHPRVRAFADRADGRVAVAAGQPGAVRALEAALATFSELEMALEAARTRVEIARAVRTTEPETALREAQLASEAFEAIGASSLLDEAAALARELGGPARTGPKAVGLLSKREREVLGLLGEGLSNAEIAARLYISTKTAGHHVGSVLAKLHLRSRAEAAAVAIRASQDDPAAK